METILTIISLLVTIIFGSLSVDLFKRKRRPCKITYFPSEAINLYRNLAKGFDNLEILKDGKPIQNNLVFLSGFFVCNGDMDISSQDNTVQMRLPTGCRWVDLKTDMQTEGFKADFNICSDNPQNADVHFDLFRINEYVRFQALVEYENRDQFDRIFGIHEKMLFSHRIQNTGDIKKGEIIRKRYKITKLRIVVCEILFILFLSFLSFFLFNKSHITYIEKGKNAEFYATINDDNMVEVQEYTSWNMFWPFSKKTITISDFEKNYKPISNFRHFNENTIPLIIIVGLFLLITVTTTIIAWLKIRRNNKLYDMFGLSEIHDEKVTEKQTPSYSNG